MPTLIDLTGQRFGRWFVMGRSEVKSRGAGSLWRCRCDCGQEKDVSSALLREGKTKSCGCLRFPDLTGQKFGRLVVLEKVAKPETVGKYYHAHWRCRCDCGSERVVRANHLTSGETVSCGCYGKEQVRKATRKHGHASRLHVNTSPTYRSWRSMWTRCTNSKQKSYKYWGARGITICDRWQSFETFLADMGERPVGATLDRIDPNGNYEPSNCRWATFSVQTRNRPKHIPNHEAVAPGAMSGLLSFGG